MSLSIEKKQMPARQIAQGSRRTHEKPQSIQMLRSINTNDFLQCKLNSEFCISQQACNKEKKQCLLSVVQRKLGAGDRFLNPLSEDKEEMSLSILR